MNYENNSINQIVIEKILWILWTKRHDQHTYQKFSFTAVALANIEYMLVNKLIETARKSG
jgi:hypothetical protein